MRRVRSTVAASECASDLDGAEGVLLCVLLKGALEVLGGRRVASGITAAAALGVRLRTSEE